MLRALQSFTCFPDGDAGGELFVSKGELFEVGDAEYEAKLVEKGHAEKVGAEKAPAQDPDGEE